MKHILWLAMKSWWCRIVGHAGVVRLWQWTVRTNMWLPRAEWTCIRCLCDVDAPPPNIPRYAMPRPEMPSEFQRLMIQMNATEIIRTTISKKTLDMLTPIPYDDGRIYEEHRQ